MKANATLGLVALLAGLWILGCNTPPQVNPWVDDSIPASEWSTPSRDGVLAANRPQNVRVRDNATEKRGPYVSRETPHYPLYWEDPFTDKGDGDDLFAWTYADYLAKPYVYGRYIVNTIGAPVSMIVHPPGTSMVSDGVIGKDHDTEVGTSPNPTAGPSDFGYDEYETSNTASSSGSVSSHASGPAPLAETEVVEVVTE